MFHQHWSQKNTQEYTEQNVNLGGNFSAWALIISIRMGRNMTLWHKIIQYFSSHQLFDRCFSSVLKMHKKMGLAIHLKVIGLLDGGTGTVSALRKDWVDLYPSTINLSLSIIHSWLSIVFFCMSVSQMMNCSLYQTWFVLRNGSNFCWGHLSPLDDIGWLCWDFCCMLNQNMLVIRMTSLSTPPFLSKSLFSGNWNQLKASYFLLSAWPHPKYRCLLWIFVYFPEHIISRWRMAN